MIAYGRTPDRYVIYPGTSFLPPNTRNGRNLKSIVTPAHTAISAAALKSIIRYPLSFLTGHFPARPVSYVSHPVRVFVLSYVNFSEAYQNHAVLRALSVLLLPRITVRITVIEIIDGIRNEDGPNTSRQSTDAATPAIALL